ncbi:MAG: hypothetical protein M5U28_27125 [Sandaracinaceae bacterium]|nr:hypothetical protein [Sandaracinaceae bacterium]
MLLSAEDRATLVRAGLGADALVIACYLEHDDERVRRAGAVRLRRALARAARVANNENNGSRCSVARGPRALARRFHIPRGRR